MANLSCEEGLRLHIRALGRNGARFMARLGRNSERLEDRRAVLKLTFADRLRYMRNEGFRTADLSLPFNFLGGIHGSENQSARPKGFEPLTPRFVGWEDF